MPTHIYHTRLYSSSESGDDYKRWNGAGWTASFENKDDLPTSRYPSDRELLIEAKSVNTAQKALNLILAACHLYRESAFAISNDMFVYPEDVDTRTDNLQYDTALTRLCLEGIPFACEIAAKASRCYDLVHAIELYRLSRMIHYNYTDDLSPDKYPHEHRSKQPRDHLRFAYAILAAYATIEQLNVQVTLKKESTIRGQLTSLLPDRSWNPPVLRDLQERLLNRNVGPNSTIMWLVRGRKTKIEISESSRDCGKYSWATGYIRDKKILVVDAINYSRWIRSNISAHRINERVATLSVYDVANVQNLSRMLILHALGYGQIYDTTLSI
jgi:hypothetical protein